MPTVATSLWPLYTVDSNFTYWRMGTWEGGVGSGKYAELGCDHERDTVGYAVTGISDRLLFRDGRVRLATRNRPRVTPLLEQKR